MKLFDFVGILPPENAEFNVQMISDLVVLKIEFNIIFYRRITVSEIDAKAIEQKVIEIVSEQMGVDKETITKETSFINDLNADSLDTVELVMEFEDEFDMSIPDEEAEKIQTVGAAVDYIVKVAQQKS